MTVSRTQEQQSGGVGDKAPSKLTRVTVNLGPRATRALEYIEVASSDSRTDSINRALQVYAFMLEVLENEGEMLVKRKGQEAPEQIHLL